MNAGAAGSSRGWCGPGARRAGQLTNPWLAVIDLGRNTVYESCDRMSGLATLDVDVTREYGAGVQLPDGRVALVGDDAEQREKNVIDLVTVGP